MAINSVSTSFIENFRIKITDGTSGLSGITGTITIQGVMTNFTTDSNGFTQWFYVIETGDLNIVGNIPAQSTFEEQAISHTFVPPEQQLEIVLAPRIDFEYNITQPIRIIEPKTGDHVGYENLLMSDITLGTRGNINQCGVHRRLKSRLEDVTLFSNATTVNLRIIQISSGAQVGSTIALTTIATNLWNTTVSWNSLAAGAYRFEIDLTVGSTTKTVKSEPMDVRESWPNYLLIEYTNFDDKKNLIFRRSPNVQYYMLVSADLLPIDDSGEINLFVDDENTTTQTHDEVFDLWRLQVLSPHPFYEIKTLQIALGLDEVFVNGTQYVKTSQGTRDVFGAHGLLLTFNIDLRTKEFDQVNYFDNSSAFTG